MPNWAETAGGSVVLRSGVKGCGLERAVGTVLAVDSVRLLDWLVAAVLEAVGAGPLGAAFGAGRAESSMVMVVRPERSGPSLLVVAAEGVLAGFFAAGFGVLA